LLNINGAYENASGFLKKFFGATLSISALETISGESSDRYEDYYDLKNKVFVLDIIHVLEYIWIIAHIKHKEGSDGGKKYVYKKLLLILQGKIASYIMELQREMLSGRWKKTQRDKFLKVITYLKNHKEYMKYICQKVIQSGS
jgi:hypothetical protein